MGGESTFGIVFSRSLAIFAAMLVRRGLDGLGFGKLERRDVPDRLSV